MFFYTLAALLATIVLATQVQSNPTTFRNQRNNKLRTLRNNLLEIKLGQSLLQNKFDVNDNVFSYLRLTIEQRLCMEENFETMAGSAIDLIEMQRLIDWVDIMKQAIEENELASCFRSSTAARKFFKTKDCSPHQIGNCFLNSNVKFFIGKALENAALEFKDEAHCRTATNNEDFISCHLTRFEERCPSHTRYTFTHPNPEMETCALFSHDMLHHILSFVKE